MTNIYLLCGIPGSGKSTWALEEFRKIEGKKALISRDVIRYALLEEHDDYFAKEEDVFRNFIRDINEKIDADMDYTIFVDATHINEASRNRVLDRLHLGGCRLFAVNFLTPVEECIERNRQRKGRSRVPDHAIYRMAKNFIAAAEGEKHPYSVINVGGDV